MEKLGKIYKSLQEVNNELDVIKKDQKGFGYMFRGIDQVRNALNPLFKKHNIIVRRVPLSFTKLPPVETKQGGLMNHMVLEMNYVFVNTEDGSEVISYAIGEGMDKGDKSILCAISNSFKSVIFEMFNIPTEEEMDSDQKTAKENKVETPTKTAKKTEAKPEEKKKASFRRKPAKKETSGEL